MTKFLYSALSGLLLLAPAAAVQAQPSAILPIPLNPVVGPDKRTCAQRTASGLGYTVLRSGAGRQPTPADVVRIGYIGYLAAGGEVFDQAPDVPMPVAGVIDGFSEGLQLMPQGSVYRLCIPARLAYGAEGVNIIPPNSDLVFQVELHDVRNRAEFEAELQQKAGPAADAAAN